MPLIKNPSAKAVSENIRRELAAGRPRKQSIAIAMDTQRRAKKGYAPGGSTPFYIRSEAHGLERMGHLPGITGGRADKVPTKVRGGSYILPSDILSGVGQGNSNAGAAAFNKMFKIGPGGAALSAIKGVQRHKFAEGGETPSEAGPVDIVASHGEYAIPPEIVSEIGGGDIERGHAMLDAMVMAIRKKTIKDLKKLPRPRTD